MDIRWLIFNSAFMKSCFWWVERALMGPDWVSLRISENNPWDCSVGLGWAPLMSWKREDTWRHAVQLLTLIGKTKVHVDGLLSELRERFIREERIYCWNWKDFKQKYLFMNDPESVSPTVPSVRPFINTYWKNTVFDMYIRLKWNMQNLKVYGHIQK